MRTIRITHLKAGVAALALGASLTLAGCNRANQMTAADNATTYGASSDRLPDLPATLPLSSGPATNVVCAPGAANLPNVAPIRTVRVADQRQSYAYVDNAYAFSNALGDAPPDYAFDYDGVDPWAWQGYDDSTVFAEPLDDGYRYYYYRAGYDEPYFIQDPNYGYGFDGGNLAVVYGLDGGIVPWADYGPRVVYASRYLARGRDLYRASRNGRRAVIAANWAQRSPAIFRNRNVWREATLRQPGWAAYRQTVAPRQQAHWQEEAIRRQADSRHYAAWQARDFKTPPPPRAIPANWQRASWARDERRFAPVRADRREQLAQQRQEQRADRRDVQRDQQQALAQREQRRDQIDARRDAQAQRDDRQQARQAQQMQRDKRQAQAQQRQQAQQVRQSQQTQRDQRQAQRQQRQQAQQARQAQQIQREQRQAQAEQRQQAQQARQSQQAQREQRQAQAQQRHQVQQARQAQQAQRDQREAQARQRQEAQQARQAQQAQREQRQAQGAERAQRQQAQQAQAAQRQQAQAQNAQRQQAQAQRQEARQQRQEARPDRGPGRER